MNDREGARWSVPDWSPDDQDRDQSYLDELEQLRARVEELNAKNAVLEQKLHADTSGIIENQAADGDIETKYNNLLKASAHTIATMRILSRRLVDLEEIPSFNNGEKFGSGRLIRKDNVSRNYDFSTDFRQYAHHKRKPPKALFWIKERVDHEIDFYFTNNADNAYVVGIEMISSINIQNNDKTVVSNVSAKSHAIGVKIGPHGSLSLKVKDTTDHHHLVEGEQYFASYQVIALTYYQPEEYAPKPEVTPTLAELEAKKASLIAEIDPLIDRIEKSISDIKTTNRLKAINKDFSFLESDEDMMELLLALGKARASRASDLDAIDLQIAQVKAAEHDEQ